MTVQLKRATLTIDGDTFQTRDPTFEPGGLMATNISRSDQGEVLYQEEYGLSTLGCTILATGNTDVLRIKRSYKNVKAVIEFHSGATYMLPNMVIDGDVVLSNGEIPITLKGGDAQKIG